MGAQQLPRELTFSQSMQWHKQEQHRSSFCLEMTKADGAVPKQVLGSQDTASACPHGLHTNMQQCATAGAVSLSPSAVLSVPHPAQQQMQAGRRWLAGVAAGWPVSPSTLPPPTHGCSSTTAAALGRPPPLEPAVPLRPSRAATAGGLSQEHLQDWTPAPAQQQHRHAHQQRRAGSSSDSCVL